MRRSFYHYLMTLRGSIVQKAESTFAQDVSEDIQFPKQAEDYETISNYLETNAYYITNMDLFDHLWEIYVENNQ